MGHGPARGPGQAALIIAGRVESGRIRRISTITGRAGSPCSNSRVESARVGRLSRGSGLVTTLGGLQIPQVRWGVTLTRSGPARSERTRGKALLVTSLVRGHKVCSNNTPRPCVLVLNCCASKPFVNQSPIESTNNEGGLAGKGESGMGTTRGRPGFETFSHRKVVGTQPANFDPLAKYPPFKVIVFVCFSHNMRSSVLTRSLTSNSFVGAARPNV